MLVGTPAGVVEEGLTGGFKRITRVPPSPETLQMLAKERAASSSPRPDAEGLSGVYEELGSRLGTREESREITDVFAALAAGLLLIGATTSAFLLKGVS